MNYHTKNRPHSLLDRLPNGRRLVVEVKQLAMRYVIYRCLRVREWRSETVGN